MSQAKGNKAKGRQSTRHAKYYETQYFRTTANKARRAKRRAFLANTPAAKLRAARREQRRLERMEKNIVRRNQAAVAKIQAERAAALPNSSHALAAALN